MGRERPGDPEFTVLNWRDCEDRLGSVRPCFSNKGTDAFSVGGRLSRSQLFGPMDEVSNPKWNRVFRQDFHTQDQDERGAFYVCKDLLACWSRGVGGGEKQGNDKGRREGRRKEKRGGGRRENTNYLVND